MVRRAKWGVGAQFIKLKIDVSLGVSAQTIELNSRFYCYSIQGSV